MSNITNENMFLKILRVCVCVYINLYIALTNFYTSIVVTFIKWSNIWICCTRASKAKTQNGMDPISDSCQSPTAQTS
jgi:hypothetical protein